MLLGWIISLWIARIDDYRIETTLNTVLGFGAYLFAERLHVSGVLAVVGAGKHITLRHVTTGAVRDQRIEITSGVNAGDRVVSKGADALENVHLVKCE